MSLNRRERDMMEKVYDAWIRPGVSPSYHERMRNRVRQDMPVLASRLDELTRIRNEKINKSSGRGVWR